MSARLLVSLSIIFLVAFVGATPGPKVTPGDTGKEVVGRMIEAHGGLEKWRSAPAVSFEDVLQPPEGPPLTSRVSVGAEIPLCLSSGSGSLLYYYSK